MNGSCRQQIHTSILEINYYKDSKSITYEVPVATFTINIPCLLSVSNLNVHNQKTDNELVQPLLLEQLRRWDGSMFEKFQDQIWARSLHQGPKSTEACHSGVMLMTRTHRCNPNSWEVVWSTPVPTISASSEPLKLRWALPNQQWTYNIYRTYNRVQS